MEGLRRALKGLSEAAFRERFGTEEACRRALFEMRWRQGLTCPACGHKRFCQLKTRELFQCNRCKRQVRLTAGTVFQDTKLPLTTWFIAIYHLTQSKNGISSIELGRRLGVKRQTAWLMKHKLMRAMGAREAHKPKLEGRVEVDDAYLGGERPGGKRGRGAAGRPGDPADRDPAGRPRRLAPLPGQLRQPVAVVQPEPAPLGGELDVPVPLELERQPDHVPVERHRPLQVSHEQDHVPDLVHVPIQAQAAATKLRRAP